jgi:pantetheine-phosphate adenylyltransferase
LPDSLTSVRKKTIAVYPGTFDPVTNGHLSLVERATRLFDSLIVAVAVNPGKHPVFSLEERLSMMKNAVSKRAYGKRVKVVGFEGLTADLAKRVGASAIVRGLRAVSDFEYEFQMALMNRRIARNVETVFLMPSLSWVYLSSTMVKDIAKHGGDIKELVPSGVASAFSKRIRSGRL